VLRSLTPSPKNQNLASWSRRSSAAGAAKGKLENVALEVRFSDMADSGGEEVGDLLGELGGEG